MNSSTVMSTPAYCKAITAVTLSQPVGYLSRWSIKGASMTPGISRPSTGATAGAGPPSERSSALAAGEMASSTPKDTAANRHTSHSSTILLGWRVLL